ncbi:MAG: LysR family transcriptional regulator [Sandaracinus sp.]
MEKSAPLDDLGVFVHVVELASMSGAARRLGVPKSTVSRAIARLEDGLRVRLFQRTTRSLSATDAGRALYAEVLPHIEALRAAASLVTRQNEAPCGPLRVTAPNDLATILLADVVTRFRQRFPEVTVELIATPRTVDLVAEGVDLAIRAGVLRDSSLVARKVLATDLWLCAAPSYLARRGTPRTVAELATHDAVAFRPKNGRAHWTFESRGDKASVEVTASISSDDYAFLTAAAVSGAGIALMPRFTADAELRAGRLVRVLPTYASPGGAVYVVHASSKHVPPKVAAFRDFLVESLRSASI